ncbi:calcium/proton exchanger [Nostocoides jenkinsii]|uniref:Ca(2+)/H(+) antiporter n=1 Tax=Nostocoides jenkinsii Ben 74 TaxID=1193518 RepID=A0A077M6C0_9MICO|nr:calcium/proton exchanger [Tetrasphaera jenkinsii]CCI52846.1 Calcium/proton exchanger [Tetrasphaera jenkinsii Ben 74]
MTHTEAAAGPTFVRSDYVILGGGALAVVLAALTHYRGAGEILPFVFAAVAVTMLASLVGRSVEQLGDRFGPGATGVLQSALGNLPELFIALFALKAGLVGVVQAALVGSILANLLLVLGLAFVVGGLKHGPQNLDSKRAQSIIVLMVLSVAAMVVPSIAHYVHVPVSKHESAFSIFTSVILLLVFAVTLPASLKRGAESEAETVDMQQEQPRWPVWLAVGLLALAAVLAAFVSDWFVAALEPAMTALNISEAFAGLVVVAIAGNAIENVVGVQLAAAGRSEYAFSVVINSPMQIALVLAPALVILSHVFGFTALTLVFSPMLVISLVIAVILTAFITFDGESTWAEGVSLIAVYAVIAASFWWG